MQEGGSDRRGEGGYGGGRAVLSVRCWLTRGTPAPPGDSVQGTSSSPDSTLGDPHGGGRPRLRAGRTETGERAQADGLQAPASARPCAPSRRPQFSTLSVVLRHEDSETQRSCAAPLVWGHCVGVRRHPAEGLGSRSHDHIGVSAGPAAGSLGAWHRPWAPSTTTSVLGSRDARWGPAATPALGPGPRGVGQKPGARWQCGATTEAGRLGRGPAPCPRPALLGQQAPREWATCACRPPASLPRGLKRAGFPGCSRRLSL